MENLKLKDLAQYIDHTNLHSDARESEIRELCAEAIQFGFKSVCIHPYYVPLAARELEGSEVMVCTVIGFPLGQNRAEAKACEARDAIVAGADEVDMVINLAACKNGHWDEVEADIRGVVEAADGHTVKVILECSMLSDVEVTQAAATARKAGAQFVKTSTGFQGRGASVDDVSRMQAACGSNVQIKASGGIRDLQTCLDMIRAGATRIGTSSGSKIMHEAEAAAKNDLILCLGDGEALPTKI